MQVGKIAESPESNAADLLLAQNELKVSQPFWFKSQIKPIILKRSELQWTPADKTSALFWSAPQNHAGGDKWKESPARPFSVGPAAIPSCPHSASPFLLLPPPTQGGGIQSKHLQKSPLGSTSIEMREFEEAKPPFPSVPPSTAGEQVSWAGLLGPSSHCGYSCKPSSSYITNANTLLCAFPRNNSPSAAWESHFVYNEVFFLNKIVQRCQKWWPPSPK